MIIDISKQEAWKILDAINCYTKDYSVSQASAKTFKNLQKKLQQLVNLNPKK